MNQPITIHSHRLFVFRLVQDVEFLVGTHLKDKAYGGGQHHGHENAQRLQEHRRACCTGKQLVQRHGHRQQQGNQQDTYDRVGKLFQKLFPQRIFLGRGQHVVTIFLATFLHFSIGQPVFIISRHFKANLLVYQFLFIFAMKKLGQKYDLRPNKKEVARLQPKI